TILRVAVTRLIDRRLLHSRGVRLDGWAFARPAVDLLHVFFCAGAVLFPWVNWRGTWYFVGPAGRARPLNGTERPSAVAAVAAAASSVVTLAWPLRVEDDASTVSGLRTLPPCERAAAMDALVGLGAADERARIAWPWHGANLGVSALVGVIIGVGLHHPTG